MVEPLELEYLASAVKEHDVEILDMRIDKGLNQKLEQFRPDFVGISAYTCNANTAKEILKEVKKFPSTWGEVWRHLQKRFKLEPPV